MTEALGSLDPLGDQWEIRQLVERYAGSADRHDGQAAAALFAADGVFEMWLDPAAAEPTTVRRGQAEIARAIGGITRYRATQHIIASHVVDIDGDEATGQTRCEAHHVEGGDGPARDRVLYIRYDDRFVRVEGRWRLARRELHVQWTSTRSVDSTGRDAT